MGKKIDVKANALRDIVRFIREIINSNHDTLFLSLILEMRISKLRSKYRRIYWRL